MSEPVIVQFERSGPRVLLIESNYRFRATGDNPCRKACRAGFVRAFHICGVLMLRRKRMAACLSTPLIFFCEMPPM